MFFTYFMAGIAFAVPELILVYNWAALKRFIERNPIFELIFSLALSWALAMLMGIGVGVTVAIANVFSTGITLFFYHFQVVEKYKRIKTKTSENKAKMQEVLDDIHTVVHAVAAPFRLVKWILHRIALIIKAYQVWRMKMRIRWARAKRAHT